MTDQQVIALFEQHRPKTTTEIQRLGFLLDHDGSGSCRDYFKLTDTIGVKIERIPKFYQTKAEVNAILRIHHDPRYAELRPHTPPVLYADPDNGILVTRHYPGLVEYGGSEEFMNAKQNLYKKFGAAGVWDLFEANTRFSADGVMMVIDLGAYTPPEPEND